MLRNLYYNCCPFAFSKHEWQDNIRTLCRHSDIFNGKRIVVLRTGEQMSPPEEVMETFAEEGLRDIEFRLRPNDPILHEVANFVETLETLESLREDEITFYAHTKGVRLVDPHWVRIESIRQWRNRMYYECLRDSDRIDKILSEHATAGCFFLTQPLPRKVEWTRWMWCGTFFWFNHAALFSQNWRYMGPEQSRFGTEDYPGLHFDEKDAFILYSREHTVGRLYLDGRGVFRCRVCHKTAEAPLRYEKHLRCCTRWSSFIDRLHIPELPDLDAGDPPKRWKQPRKIAL